MSVTGRALASSPRLGPTELRSSRKRERPTSDRRRVTVSFDPAGETKDIAFPFLNKGLARKLSIRIVGWFPVNARVGEGGTKEEFGVSFKFTWPEGVTGSNPQNPLAFVRESGLVIGAVFGKPVNECLPTIIDGLVLKVAYHKNVGTAKADRVDLFLEVLESWELEPEAVSSSDMAASGRTLGVARPKLRVIACNGGSVTLPPPPEEERGTAG